MGLEPTFYFRLMHRQNQAFIDLFEPELAALGYELLGVELSRSGNGSLLRIYIDKDDGITIDDCVLVSQQLTGILDVEDPTSGNYELEVSSPGVDRPLFTLAQIERFVGSPIKLRLHTKLDGRRNISAVLISVENENLILDSDNEELVVPFNMIERARLIPEY